MVASDRIGLVLRRRRGREQLAARRVARERAAIERLAAQRSRQLRGESPVVPTQGDLICFKVAVRPC
jgi:hypothetical protein